MLSITVLLITNIISLYAEDIFFQIYGINEGLSSNVVFGIEEDKNGLLWIATTEGVDKFDGLNFKHYDLPQLTLNGVADYMEFYIESDSKGQIWLATKSGLIYKYNVLKDEFQLIHQFQQKPQTHSSIWLRTIYIDHKDNIMISLNDGVWQMDHATHKVHQLSQNIGVLAINQDTANYYYWSDNRGIQILDTAFQEVDHFYPEGEVNHKINRLYIDNEEQTLWGVSEKEGVFFINLKNGKITFPKPLHPYKNLAIRAINRFSEEEIVIGVDGVGLVLWNTSNQSITQEITYQGGKKGTLSSNAIYDIHHKSDGTFFISTHRGGINVYNPNKLNFGYINSTYKHPNSLANNYILSIQELSLELIGFGTYEGISIWDKKKDQWQHLSDGDLNVSDVILSLAVDKEQNIWATSFTHSPMLFEKLSNNFYEKSENQQCLSDIRPEQLCVDRKNRIWFSNYKGLYLYSPEADKLEHFPLNGVLTLTNLSDNLLVLGRPNGLSFFDTETFKLQDFDFIEAAKLEMRLVKCLKLDSRNRLWVGTKTDGLFVVDFQTKTIRNISVEDGLPVNHIFSIAIGKKDLWVSTLKGISKIDNNFNVVNYTASDGIASIDFNYDAALCDQEGTLYFGTNDGVVTLKPKAVSSLLHKNIFFSEFWLNHKRILPGKDAPLKTEPHFVNKIKLKHFQNSFSLGFECVDFVQPERGFFHWKLENFDADWVVSDQLSNIIYTNLNAGDYTFIIKVLDERGRLISNEKAIKISIAKPWWLTQWAISLYAILSLLIIGAISYFYRLHLQSKNSSERLGFLINLAHEIKTPLLLIKAPLNDLLSSENITGIARKNVSIALSSTERLHRQMLQFLDMGNLSKIENTISLEHTDLVQFLNEKITAFNVLAKKKNIRLTAEYETPNFSIKTDKKVLDKIVSNLLSNAIKYTNEGGKVVLKQETANAHCHILVIDSGIGILKSEQKNIFKPFYRTDRAKRSGFTGNGVGLVLASNLAKMLNGKLSLVESSNEGTTFEFKFPYEPSEEVKPVVQKTNIQSPLNKNSIKILLVEDDEDLLNYSIRKLQDNYQILTARNGIEAIEKCEQNLPNLIISDVLMPKMDGIQLCIKLKSDVKTSHIPVILFTALDGKKEILEGLEAGADDYIVKPFEFDILSKKIETLLNNRLILQKKFLFQTNENEEIGFASKLDDEWMNEVNKFIEEHIEEPELTPAMLYKQFGMSRSAFYHKTKTLVDLSPIELIRTIRLKKAKSLLGTPENSVSEVAYKLGFNDPKYFSTVFKRYFGQTPSSFIAQKKALRQH